MQCLLQLLLALGLQLAQLPGRWQSALWLASMVVRQVVSCRATKDTHSATSTYAQTPSPLAVVADGSRRKKRELLVVLGRGWRLRPDRCSQVEAAQVAAQGYWVVPKHRLGLPLSKLR